MPDRRTEECAGYVPPLPPSRAPLEPSKPSPSSTLNGSWCIAGGNAFAEPTTLNMGVQAAYPAREYHSAVLNNFKLIASKRDGCGCDGYAEPSTKNAGPPSLVPATARLPLSDGERGIPREARDLVRLYAGRLNANGDDILRIWEGHNDNAVHAAWRVTLRTLFDGWQAAQDNEAAGQRDGPRADDDHHVVARMVQEHVLWAKTLVHTFLGPAVVWQPRLYDRLPDEQRQLVDELQKEADQEIDTYSKDDEAAVKEFYARNWRSRFDANPVDGDPVLLYNLSPLPPNRHAEKRERLIFEAYCEARANGIFLELVDDPTKRATHEPRGTLSSFDCSSNANGRALDYGALQLPSKNDGYPGVAVSAATLAAMPPAERAQVRRSLLGTFTACGPRLAARAPKLLAAILGSQLAMQRVVERLLPEMFETQAAALPAESTVLQTWPILIHTPRALHPDLCYDNSTTFFQRIVGAVGPDALSPTLLPSDHDMYASLPGATQLYRHDKARLGLTVHVDGHDAYREVSTADGARRELYGLFHSAFSVNECVLAPGSGVTLQMAGVHKGGEGRVGIKTQVAKQAATMEIARAQPNGYQVFSAGRIPHTNTVTAFDSSVPESERRGYGAEWRETYPEVPPEVNGIPVSPEVRLFFNLRLTQLVVETNAMLGSIDGQPTAMLLATPLVTVGLRYFGLLRMGKREKRWTERSDLAGFAWGWAFLHIVNQFSGSQQTRRDAPSKLSQADKLIIKRVRDRERRTTTTPKKPAPPSGTLHQFCADHVLNIGDVIDVRWHDRLRRSKVVGFDRQLGAPPNEFERHRFNAGFEVLYHLMHDDPTTCQLEGVPSKAVKLEGYKVKRVTCANARRSRRCGGQPPATATQAAVDAVPAPTLQAYPTRSGLTSTALVEVNWSEPEAADVGRRLRVYWEKDDEWFEGHLRSVRCSIRSAHGGSKGDEGNFEVDYDDGDRFWEQLGTNVIYAWLTPRRPACPPLPSEPAALFAAQGYVVIRSALSTDFCESTLEGMKAAEWGAGLPTGRGRTIDSARRQTIRDPTAPWEQACHKVIPKVLEDRGLKGRARVVDLHGLQSLPHPKFDPDAAIDSRNAKGGAQNIHTDYDATDFATYMQSHAPADAPFSIMFDVMGGTRLALRPYDGVWIVVKLDPGDMLLFRGDVEHYGVGYPEQHFRVHAYGHAADFEKGAPSVYTRV